MKWSNQKPLQAMIVAIRQGLIMVAFGLLAACGTLQSGADHDQSQSQEQQAKAARANEVAVLNNRGVQAREQGDFKESEAYYRQALAIAPDYQPALINLAILLELYQGRLQEALDLVEQVQAMQVEPDPQVENWVFDLNNRIH